jgi:hypothetical protein
MIDITRQILQKMPQLNSMIRQSVEANILSRFNKIKAFIITSFYNHPVTTEILHGMADPYGAENTSGTLGGYGNLYAFIGFPAGTDPIEPILEVLEQASLSSVTVSSKGVRFSFSLPSPEDVWEVTPMPWADGRSWAHGIESGISGLGEFLSTDKSDASLSGGGIQAKHKIRPRTKFQNTRYISSILKTFRDKVNEMSI